jgi:hypothetical protein
MYAEGEQGQDAARSWSRKEMMFKIDYEKSKQRTDLF